MVGPECPVRGHHRHPGVRSALNANVHFHPLVPSRRGNRHRPGADPCWSGSSSAASNRAPADAREHAMGDALQRTDLRCRLSTAQPARRVSTVSFHVGVTAATRAATRSDHVRRLGSAQPGEVAYTCGPYLETTTAASILRRGEPSMATSVCRLMGSLLALVSVALLAPPVARADGPLTYLRSVPLAAMAHDILVEGDLAYVATDTGLTILDVSDPANPTVLGSALAPDVCQGLAKKGSYIYLAAATGGMQVIDVSKPDAPLTVANAK